MLFGLEEPLCFCMFFSLLCSLQLYTEYDVDTSLALIYIYIYIFKSFYIYLHIRPFVQSQPHQSFHPHVNVFANLFLHGRGAVFTLWRLSVETAVVGQEALQSARTLDDDHTCDGSLEESCWVSATSIHKARLMRCNLLSRVLPVRSSERTHDVTDDWESLEERNASSLKIDILKSAGWPECSRSFSHECHGSSATAVGWKCGLQCWPP